MTTLSCAVYERPAWQDIVEGDHLFLEVAGQAMTCDERGVWIRGVEHPSLNWHPFCELDDPIVHDPRQNPHLPFPFSAAHLAAFMIDGVGYFLRERFGELGGEPDEESLAAFPAEAGKAKHAVRAAFKALREAQTEVGALDQSLDARAKELCERCEAMRKQARRELDVDLRLTKAAWAKTIEESNQLRDQLRDEAWMPFDEWCASPDFVRAREACEKAQREADAARAAWLKKMVQHLLGDEPARRDLDQIKPVQRSQAQDAAILSAIRAAGYDPQNIPKNPNGKPGVKAEIRAKVNQNHLALFPPKGTTFDKAWDRLRSRGEVADRQA